MTDAIVSLQPWSTARGCFSFGLAACLGLFATSFAVVAPATLLEDQGVLDAATAKLVGIMSGSVLGVGVVAFLWRAWRRRRGQSIGVHEDRIERVVRGRHEVVPFGEVDALHMFRTSEGVSRVLVVGRTRTMDIRKGEWSVGAIAVALEDSLVPKLVANARRAVGAGETLTFREPSSSGPVALALGLFLLAGAAALVGASLHAGKFHVEPVVAILAASFFLIQRWFAALGGGIVMTRTGLRRIGEDASSEVPFRELRPWKLRPWGLLVEVGAGERAGQQLRLTHGGGNQVVLLDLLQERLPRDPG